MIKTELQGGAGGYSHLELPQSGFIGILGKWHAGRAPLNSSPHQREDYLNGSGGTACWVNVK